MQMTQRRVLSLLLQLTLMANLGVAMPFPLSPTVSSDAVLLNTQALMAPILQNRGLSSMDPRASARESAREARRVGVETQLPYARWSPLQFWFAHALSLGTLFGLPMGVGPLNPQDPPSDGLTPVQWGRVEEVVHKYGLGEADKMYLAELWRQRLYPDPHRKPLRIGADASKGENFLLASDLSDRQRRDWLGAISYEELVTDPENAQAAQSISLTINSMDGGIGENVGRLQWLRTRANPEHAGSVVMGAKGTDLGYDLEIGHRTEFVSVAEAKLLQLIEIARNKKFAQLYIQPLVNGQSRRSYENLLNQFYFFDRINEMKPDSQKFTYRQIFQQVGIKLHSPEEMLMQADLPGIEVESGLVTLNDKGLRQPGGHGQWGVAFLWDAYRTTPPADGKIHVRMFSNGDNVNGRASEVIAGYMARHRIPILKLTTAATPIDKKGGKDGVRIVPLGDHVVYVPDQMELADAKSAGQVSAFYDAGQHGAAQQPFNTNIIYMNLSLLHPILQDLKEVIGEEMVARVIAPVLITKDAKEKEGVQYVPLDGAIGVAVHNLNAFFQTSSDPRVKAILMKHGVDRILRFVDVPRSFFAPVKSTFDIWWQRHSDFYRFDHDQMVLVDAEPGLVPPEVDLTSPLVGNPKKDDGYWNELQNLVESFGNAGTRKLRSLTIKGPVRLVDAELVGHVSILNESGHLIDLRAPQYREALTSVFDEHGKLILEDDAIVINAEGQIAIQKISPATSSPGAEAVWGRALMRLGPSTAFGIAAILEGLRVASMAQLSNGSLRVALSAAFLSAVIHLLGVFIPGEKGEWKAVGIQNLSTLNHMQRENFWMTWLSANWVASSSLLAFVTAHMGAPFAVTLLIGILPHVLLNLKALYAKTFRLDTTAFLRAA